MIKLPSIQQVDQDNPAKVRQLTRQISTMITSGAIPPGAQLWPENALAAMAGVDRTTVRQVYQKLLSAGLVKVVHGAGTYVREYRRVQRWPAQNMLDEWQRALLMGSEDHSLIKDLIGTEGEVDVDKRYEQVLATQELADAFDDETLFRLKPTLLLRRYLISIDGKPHSLSLSHLRLSDVRGTALMEPANERRGRGTFAQLLDIGIDLVGGGVELCDDAVMPDFEQEIVLNLLPGTPLIVTRKRVIDANWKIHEVAYTCVPGDRESHCTWIPLTRDPVSQYRPPNTPPEVPV